MKNFLLLFVMLLTARCTKHIAGTTDETITGTQAAIYYANGAPAPGVTVKAFDVNDTSRVPAAQTVTDNTGHYALGQVAKGTYNIWAEQDTLVAVQDSVYISPATNTIHQDTLQASGSLTAIIGMQPNDDPRSAYVQMTGSDRFSRNINENGAFTIDGLATGSYSLRISTTLPNYTPTFFTVSAVSGKADTLKDTLQLVYTGIPVVTGMKASYDTLNGLVHLSWNNVNYRNFQDFLVFRDYYDSINLSINPVAAPTATSFVDSIFKRIAGSGPFSFADTNDYHFKYRVCIENNSANRGETYKYVDIIAASPKKVETTFAFTSFHIAKKFFTDSASINDSVLWNVKVSNPTRNLNQLAWIDLATRKIVRTVTLDSTKKTGGDTLKYSWNTLGVKGLGCTVTDMAGTAWTDTALITIVKDSLIVSVTYSPHFFLNNDTIHIHLNTIDKYGKIALIGWNAGDSGNFSPGAGFDSTIDMNIIEPGMLNTNDTGSYRCVVKVTDDHSNIVYDTIKLQRYAVDIDGNAYQTVRIGTQVWMVENLQTTHYNDGTAITLDTNTSTWGNLTTEAYCWYNNDSTTYKNTYGALYNWYAVNTGKLAPKGWHVPSDSEWEVLGNYFGGDNVAGGPLKSTSTLWFSPNIGATNSSGFSALPGGYRTNNGTFTTIGSVGYWWSTSAGDASDAWSRSMSDYPSVFLGYYSMVCGFSVRCVRN